MTRDDFIQSLTDIAGEAVTLKGYDVDPMSKKVSVAISVGRRAYGVVLPRSFTGGEEDAYSVALEPMRSQIRSSRGFSDQNRA